jgi:hypothetical protein
MGAFYWNTEQQAATYLAEHPTEADRCDRRLGPLETADDAVRWAYLTYLADAVTPVWATLWILNRGLTPWYVWIDKLGMLSTLFLHYTQACREKETQLFLSLLNHKSRQVRMGALIHLAGVGTRLAFPKLLEKMRTGTSGERFLAFATLCEIGDASISHLVEEEAKRARVLKSVYHRKIDRLRRRLGFRQD